MKKISKFIASAMALCCFTANVSTYNARPVYALTITAGITNVSVVKDTIATGESVQLEIEWSTGAKQTVIYESSDESIATVDENGIVTGIGEGTAVITLFTPNNNKSKTIEITVSEDVIPSVYYNTSELTLGQKLNKYDTLHYDNKNVGGWANIVNSKGSYDLAFISEEDYVLPFNAEVVDIDFSTLYLAPELDDVNYLDGRTLEAGDVIDTNTHLLCYDYVINERVLPVFLPKYYKEYIGDGIIKVQSVDHENKSITLESVPQEIIAGDANGDGEFGVADAVMLQKWLIGAGELNDWKNADLNNDNQVDVFDFCIMREKLAENGIVKRNITREEFVDLLLSKEEFTWSDFEQYKSEDIGSGNFILKYEIEFEDSEDNYFFYISGASMDEKPDRIYVEAPDGETKDIYELREVLLGFIKGFQPPENSETDRNNALKISEYAFNGLKDGSFNLRTSLYYEDIADNELLAELWSESRVLYVRFADEHNVIIGLNGGGFFDVYGYLITDGTVEYELGWTDNIATSYDGGGIDIQERYDNIYFFHAGT